LGDQASLSKEPRTRTFRGLRASFARAGIQAMSGAMPGIRCGEVAHAILYLIHAGDCRGTIAPCRSMPAPPG
jgi:hypothetical protein